MNITRKKSPRVKVTSCKDLDTPKTHNMPVSSSANKDSLSLSSTAPPRIDKGNVVTPSHASNTFLRSQTHHTSIFPSYSATTLRELELSRNHLRDLESLLTRIICLLPKIKEALR